MRKNKIVNLRLAMSLISYISIVFTWPLTPVSILMQNREYNNDERDIKNIPAQLKIFKI